MKNLHIIVFWSDIIFVMGMDTGRKQMWNVLVAMIGIEKLKKASSTHTPIQ